MLYPVMRQADFGQEIASLTIFSSSVKAKFRIQFLNYFCVKFTNSWKYNFTCTSKNLVRKKLDQPWRKFYEGTTLPIFFFFPVSYSLNTNTTKKQNKKPTVVFRSLGHQRWIHSQTEEALFLIKETFILKELMFRSKKIIPPSKQCQNVSYCLDRAYIFTIALITKLTSLGQEKKKKKSF